MEQKQKYQVTTNPIETKGAKASLYLTTLVNGEPASEFIADFEKEERANDTCNILNNLLKSITGQPSDDLIKEATNAGTDYALKATSLGVDHATIMCIYSDGYLAASKMYLQPSPANAAPQPPHVRKEDIEAEWEKLWKDIVTNPDGSINIEQLKKELYDFSYVMEQVPKVYCHITGDSLSKIMYPAETVIRVADDYTSEIVEREMADRQEGLKWVRASERIPDIDHASDYPKEYVTRCKNDGSRGRFDVYNLEAQRIIELNKSYDYCEWLDESTS